MITRQWWLGLTERAIKTGCQAMIATLVAGQGALNLLPTSWQAALGVSLTAAVMSVLTTLAGIQVVTGNASPNALVPFATLPRAQAPVPDLGSSLTRPIPRLREETLDTPT